MRLSEPRVWSYLLSVYVGAQCFMAILGEWNANILWVCLFLIWVRYSFIGDAARGPIKWLFPGAVNNDQCRSARELLIGTVIGIADIALCGGAIETASQLRRSHWPALTAQLVDFVALGCCLGLSPVVLGLVLRLYRPRRALSGTSTSVETGAAHHLGEDTGQAAGADERDESGPPGS